jgi:excinuclease ABC subunit C
VAMLDGLPDKKRYKSYNVRSTAEGDDYAAMYEVLARRFRRGRNARAAETTPLPPAVVEGETRPSDPDIVDGPDSAAKRERDAEWDLPDLFVVDGGRGQLNVALAAARDLGIFDLPIVGLAKERESITGDKVVDRVYLPGQKNGIALKSASSALFFLARVRDEAHRFANYARERQQKGRTLRSALGDVPGIGQKAERALLTELGSLRAVIAATDERILAVKGISKRHLSALRFAFPPPASPAIEIEVAVEAEVAVEIAVAVEGDEVNR